MLVKDIPENENESIDMSLGLEEKETFISKSIFFMAF